MLFGLCFRCFTEDLPGKSQELCEQAREAEGAQPVDAEKEVTVEAGTASQLDMSVKDPLPSQPLAIGEEAQSVFFPTDRALSALAEEQKVNKPRLRARIMR